MSSFPPFNLVTGNRQRPLTCLGDASELLSRPTNGFDREMPADYFMRSNPRKWWEWGYLAECAEACGVLNDDSRGIGLGAGSEPLMFHFANHCRDVLATDLYSADTIWKEAKVSDTDVIIRDSPIALCRDNLRIANGDMRALPTADGSFDFAWSCSSIEHIDTVSDLVRIFGELARILRPGGIALLTTEFCLTEAPYLLPGINALDNELFSTVVAQNPAFRLIGDMDLGYNWAFPGNGIKPRRDLPNGMEQLNQRQLADLFRSRSMAVPVGQSVIAPIAFTLERTGAPALDWNSIELRPDIRAYSDALSAADAGRLTEASDAFRALLADPGEDLTCQFETHIRKNLVGVMALQFESGEVDATALGREADELAKCAAGGLMADGDCLHLAGNILNALGKLEEAYAALTMGATSASSLTSSALEMAVLAMDIGKRTNRKGDDLLYPVVQDLLNHGYPALEIRGQLERVLQKIRYSTDEMRDTIEYLSERCLTSSSSRYRIWPDERDGNDQ